MGNGPELRAKVCGGKMGPERWPKVFVGTGPERWAKMFVGNGPERWAKVRGENGPDRWAKVFTGSVIKVTKKVSMTQNKTNDPQGKSHSDTLTNLPPTASDQRQKRVSPGTCTCHVVLQESSRIIWFSSPISLFIVLPGSMESAVFLKKFCRNPDFALHCQPPIDQWKKAFIAHPC